MNVTNDRETKIKWFAIGSTTTLAIGVAIWKGAPHVDWRAIRARILSLSDEQQIREMLTRVPRTDAWQANAKFMESSLDAGRNVVVPKELLKFLDPDVPIETIFEKGKALGAGAFGSVDMRFDSQGREFAVKAMRAQPWHSQLLGTTDFEIGLALDHPNIVRVHNFVTKSDGMNYLIMEYIPGRTLWDVGKNLSSKQTLKLGRELVDALKHSLHRGIMPWDLHSGNMMVTNKGTLKLVDLGLYHGIRGEGLPMRRAYWQLKNAFWRLLPGTAKQPPFPWQPTSILSSSSSCSRSSHWSLPTLTRNLSPVFDMLARMRDKFYRAPVAMAA